MNALARRLRRLERERLAADFDPRAVCLLASDCYERGEPLPASLTPQERELAAAMLDMLIRSEPANWWSDLPLPLPAVGDREAP